MLLVLSSRRRLFVVASCRLVSFRPCVLLVADAGGMSSVGRLMSVASCRGRIVSLRIVSSCISSWAFRLVLIPFRLALVVIVAEMRLV